ncbi:hypothetical protein BC940DRAFT_75706 [Gongronella butleri]|nr:hypothetical protein BC940DRAFT_75706 [Gongronella butleri]
MHKSHQSRLTAVTNQLRSKHGDEINALLDAFDKELQAKQDGSEASAQLDAKRKHMIECERLLQERTRELQDAKERHERELQDVRAANAQALKDAEQANQDEIERQVAELKDRLDQLVADHEADMEKKHVHHQADMATLRSWSLAPEARAQMLADIEASIGQEGLQYVAQLKHEHATKLADIEAQIKEHQTRLDTIKAQHSELLNSHKDEQAAAYEDRKAAAFVNF